jgi:hypothetical protein
MSQRVLPKEVGSKLISCFGICWKLLAGKESWLRGVDLNHRPLGYEFDLWFTLVHAGPYISMR